VNGNNAGAFVVYKANTFFFLLVTDTSFESSLIVFLFNFYLISLKLCWS
jgi:hypothetical protein